MSGFLSHDGRVTVEVVVDRETDKAYLVYAEAGFEEWVPKSRCFHFEWLDRAIRRARIVISRELAEEKGLYD
jgi:hypothetical protein